MLKTLRKSLFVAALGGVAITGCAALPSDSSSSETVIAQRITITGHATYRERIALAPGYVFNVTLSDVSISDHAAPVLAKTTRTLGTEQVPLSFKMDVDTSETSSNGKYAIRATLTDPLGNLEWTTDTTNTLTLDAGGQDVGTLLMAKAAPDGPNDAELAARLRANQWRVESINGGGVVDNAKVTIVFQSDGRLGGSSGCNSYNGAYSIENERLHIRGVATSLRACAPALMDMERKFLIALDGAATLNFDQDGRLTLQSSDGQSVTAISAN